MYALKNIEYGEELSFDYCSVSQIGVVALIRSRSRKTNESSRKLSAYAAAADAVGVI
jgi:hypothetical protein